MRAGAALASAARTRTPHPRPAHRVACAPDLACRALPPSCTHPHTAHTPNSLRCPRSRILSSIWVPGRFWAGASGAAPGLWCGASAPSPLPPAPLEPAAAWPPEWLPPRPLGAPPWCSLSLLRALPPLLCLPSLPAPSLSLCRFSLSFSGGGSSATPTCAPARQGRGARQLWAGSRHTPRWPRHAKSATAAAQAGRTRAPPPASATPSSPRTLERADVVGAVAAHEHVQALGAQRFHHHLLLLGGHARIHLRIGAKGGTVGSTDAVLASARAFAAASLLLTGAAAVGRQAVAPPGPPTQPPTVQPPSPPTEARGMYVSAAPASCSATRPSPAGSSGRQAARSGGERQA